MGSYDLFGRIDGGTFCGEPIERDCFRDVHEESQLALTKIPVSLLRKFCELKGIPYPLDTEAERKARQLAKVEQKETVPMPAALALDEAEVVGGLTVGAVRNVFDHSPALRDIVAAVADWQKPTTDGGELSRRSVNEILQLKQTVEDKAAAGNWGTDKGKLSEPQGRVIERLIFGRSSGGSGNSSVWYGTRDKAKKKG